MSRCNKKAAADLSAAAAAETDVNGYIPPQPARIQITFT
jgi:hypothetical protein